MDKSESLISIIIPTFNRGYCIERAIESVAHQSGENWELIIIDDGSTDRTSVVVQEYLNDLRIKYYFQENRGVSAARNLGAEYAAGEYLIFLDSDDYLEPDLVKKLSEENFTNYDIICWQVLKNIDGKESLWKPVQLDGLYNNITGSFLAGSICYKKDIFFKVGGFDPQMKFGENYELGIRIAKLQGLSIKLINKVFLKYNLNTRARESNSIENRLSSHLHQLDKHKNLYKSHPKILSGMYYMIGFVLEKKGDIESAKAFYKSSWKTRRSNVKAFLKTIYLKFLR